MLGKKPRPPPPPIQLPTVHLILLRRLRLCRVSTLTFRTKRIISRGHTFIRANTNFTFLYSYIFHFKYIRTWARQALYSCHCRPSKDVYTRHRCSRRRRRTHKILCLQSGSMGFIQGSYILNSLERIHENNNGDK